MNDTTTQNDSATQPDDTDWDSLPDGEFAARIFDTMEAKPAQITCEDMDKMESWWRESMTGRRCALIMITEPWSDLRKKVEDSREFAEAMADVYTGVGDVIGGCRGILECLEAAQNWMMVALARREDMEELLEHAKKERSEREAAS